VLEDDIFLGLQLFDGAELAGAEVAHVAQNPIAAPDFADELLADGFAC
jgi:hypothetical protein